MKVILRAYDPKTDDPFIYATWSKNEFHGQKRTIKVKKKDWFSAKFKYIENLLNTGEIKIACLQDDPYFIIGYAVFNKEKLEWIYVKQDYRNCGIENLLTGDILNEC